MVMKYVEPFLIEIKRTWREELEIDTAVAESLEGCKCSEVAIDARMVFDELLSQGFVELTGGSWFRLG